MLFFSEKYINKAHNANKKKLTIKTFFSILSDNIPCRNTNCSMSDIDH